MYSLFKNQNKKILIISIKNLSINILILFQIDKIELSVLER